MYFEFVLSHFRFLELSGVHQNGSLCLELAGTIFKWLKKIMRDGVLILGAHFSDNKNYCCWSILME